MVGCTLATRLRLLAKTGVEQAIEQDEEKTTTWINQQLESGWH